MDRWKRTAVLVLVFCLVAGAIRAAEPSGFGRDVRRIPAKNLASYGFSPGSSLEDRVGAPPGFVLDYLREMDHRPDYRGYEPTAEERRLVGEYLTMLPPLHRRLLPERLVGLYFVEGFLGSGLTEYVLDDADRIFVFLVFNPDVLRHGMSEWLTMKESTCFIPGSADVVVDIDLGPDYLGLLYILLHETTHAVDYLQRISPFVERSVIGITGQGPVNSFIDGVWHDYREPVENDFPYGDRITFYGMNNGPKISLTQALTMYDKLRESPFASIYSAQSWAEDLAEFVTFYHLTQKMGLPYRITVRQGEETLLSFEPMDGPEVRRRLPFMERFYEPADQAPVHEPDPWRMIWNGDRRE